MEISNEDMKAFARAFTRSKVVNTQMWLEDNLVDGHCDYAYYPAADIVQSLVRQWLVTPHLVELVAGQAFVLELEHLTADWLVKEQEDYEREHAGR